MPTGAIQLSVGMAPTLPSKLQQILALCKLLTVPAYHWQRVSKQIILWHFVTCIYSCTCTCTWPAFTCICTRTWSPTHCFAIQVLQLQSATTASSSQPVDYQAGIEAMVLAILQQTNYSQQTGLAELGPLSVLTSQDQAVQDALLLTAYSTYLSSALDANANLTATVETSLLNMTFSSSVLPVSYRLGTCGLHLWQMHGSCVVSAGALALAMPESCQV